MLQETETFIVLLIILSSLLVKADSSVAYWTRAYCMYNAGSGGYACDSGQVSSSNTASCNAANGVQCGQEGDVYCYAQSNCEAGGVTNQGPTNAYNVNWDSDSADCQCKVGTGRWAIPFEPGLQGQCCGDDTNEFYAGTGNGRSCDGTQACCNSASDYVLNSNCVASCPSVTAVYWTDLAGVKINQTQVNDYIMLVAETTNAEGMLVNFTLWEEGLVKCYEDYYSSYSQSGKASLLWKVKLCQDGASDGNKFKSFMSITPSVYLESELLSVSLTEDDTPPVAAISQPPEGSIFNLGEVINFVSGSYDADDLITSTRWDFGDGYTSNFANTTHAFSSGGPKFVTLTVQNSRGKTAETKIGIMINSSADDPPLAIISQPAYSQKFSGMLVTFNATLSIDDITPFNQLIFKWEFDDGSYPYSAKGIEGAYFTKLFSTSGEHLVKLTVDDSEPTSSVETTFYISGCQVPLDGTFEFVPLDSCSVVSKHYFCANETTYYDTMIKNCEGPDKQALTADDCCPRGFYCPAVGAACTERPSDCGSYNSSVECEQYGCAWLNGSCVDPAGMSSCSDYKGESACNADSLGLGKPIGKGLGTDICGRTFGNYLINSSSCKCLWGPAGNPSGDCRFNYEVLKIIPGNVPFITCMKSFSLSGCIAGVQNMNWTAAILPIEMQTNETAQQQCSSGYKEIRCGTAISRLPFFSIANLISAATIIIIYYMFTISKKKL